MKKNCPLTKRNIIYISFIVLGIAFILPLILVKYDGIKFDDLGTYGDFFGCFNSLVSALAFGGLIYTIYLQRRDLELQRQELKLTRQELSRQAEAQEKAAQEQEEHAKILKEQLYKEVRPYLNTYLTLENNNVYLIIKNIGKSACNSFSIVVKSILADNGEAKIMLQDVKKRLESVKFSIIPSGLDNAIPLEITNDNVTDTLLSSSIELHFKFFFQGKEDGFDISFNFNELQAHGDPMVRALYAIASRISSSRPY